MRNPIMRKKPPTPWGEKPVIKGFGTNETPFNTHVVDQLNLTMGVAVTKIGGGMYNSGKPDIMGMAWLEYVALENKFIKKLPMKDDTPVLSRKSYRPGQIDFLTTTHEAILEYQAWQEEDEGISHPQPIVGSLIGVLSTPKIILGVPAKFVIDDKVIRTYQLVHCLQIAKNDYTPFFFFDPEDLDRPTPCDTIGELLRSIQCHW